MESYESEREKEKEDRNEDLLISSDIQPTNHKVGPRTK